MFSMTYSNKKSNFEDFNETINSYSTSKRLFNLTCDLNEYCDYEKGLKCFNGFCL